MKMKKELKKKLVDDLKFFYRLKFKTRSEFADHLKINGTRLSTLIHRETTYAFIILRLVLECDTVANVKVTDKVGDVLLEFSSNNAAEISEKIGKSLETVVLREYSSVTEYAKELGVFPGKLYQLAKGHRKPAIDTICDYLEQLGYKLQISIKKA